MTSGANPGSAPVEAPALPWARVDSQTAPSRAADAIARGRDVSLFSQRIGSRIEVKWQLTDEETDETTTRWWGAVIQSVDDTLSRPDKPVYNLWYDAHGDHDAEAAEVAFLDQHMLYDLGACAEMAWRAEGDDFSEADASGSEEGEGEEAAEGGGDEWMHDTFTSAQLLAATDGVEDGTDAMLRQLPMDRQQLAAQAFRHFTDSFKAYVSRQAEAARAGGATEFVVTGDAVREFLRDFKPPQ